MTLRQKTLWVAGLTFICLVLALHYLLSDILLRGFVGVEERDMHRQIEQVQNAFQGEIDNLRFTAKDWGEWDDTYAFIQDKNAAYRETNLNDATIARLSLNVVLYLDSSGDRVFATAFDLRSLRRLPVPSSLDTYLTPDQLLRTAKTAQSGLLNLPEGTLLIVSQPILKSDGSGPARGTLIFGRYFDRDALKRLAEKTGLNLKGDRFTAQPPTPDMADVLTMLQSGQPVVVRPINEAAIAGYTLVNDLGEEPALWLRVISPRDIYQQAKRTQGYIDTALVLFGLVAAGLSLLLVEKLVLSRLLRLGRQVQQIGFEGSLDRRLPVKGEDELADLAAAINRMLETLALAQRDRLSSEARYRSIFENAVEGIFQTTPDGRYINANPALARIYGYQSPRELIAMLTDISHQLYVQPQRREVFTQSLRQQGVLSDFESQVFRKDGSVIWISENARVVHDDDGQPLYYEGTVEDISERKRIEQMKNEFVSVVSHELRTPLTSIRGSLGLIAGGVAGEISTQARSLIDIAYKNCERLIALINDILDIEKIESGKMHFDLKPVELDGLLRQTLEMNRAYGNQYGVSFVVTQSLPGVQVNVDGDRLIQVITNLLSNAAKFSKPGETVEVAITQRGSVVRLSVTDHGSGIPEAFRDRIFQKFAQADSSDTRQKGGTGLGLSISKAIIEKLGGHIGFATEVGVGTTFFFDLPTWAAQPLAPLAQPQAIASAVLICEDDPDIASLLKLMLKQGGIAADIAYTAAQAKEKLATRDYAAMTLDLQLPGQDGLSLIRELREQEAFRQLPIVVVSAMAKQGEQELQGAGIAVWDWLEKPIDQNRLLDVIHHAVMLPLDHRPQILHIEDDADVAQVVSAILHDAADVVMARSLAEVKQRLSQQPFDLIILDIELPDGSGLDLLSLLNGSEYPPIPVVIFSAQETGSDIAHEVSAALVKSRTSNQQLLDTILSLVRV